MTDKIDELRSALRDIDLAISYGLENSLPDMDLVEGRARIVAAMGDIYPAMKQHDEMKADLDARKEAAAATVEAYGQDVITAVINLDRLINTNMESANNDDRDDSAGNVTPGGVLSGR